MATSRMSHRRGATASRRHLPKASPSTRPGHPDFSAGAVKAVGTLEVLAAVGLILPAALDIAPVLVPLAAVGLVLLMVGAITTHLRRHETQAMVVTLPLLAEAAVVAWGRFGPYSFTGRPSAASGSTPHRACLRYQPPDMYRTPTGLA
jgi:DoxX-like family